MSEPHEQSYYEIALSNRQVTAAFVVLLVCLLAAFFSGIWIGRTSAGPGPGERLETGPAEAEEAGDARPQEFRFFTEGKAPAPPPPLSTAVAEARAAETRPETTLAQDLGAVPKAAGPPAGAEGEDELVEEPAPPPPPPPPPPEPVQKPAAEPPAEGEGLFVQVFSSHDKAQADKVMARLVRAGFEAFLSPAQMEDRVMYRVRIGPFAERAAADRVATQVRAKTRLETWITQ